MSSTICLGNQNEMIGTIHPKISHGRPLRCRTCGARASALARTRNSHTQ